MSERIEQSTEDLITGELLWESIQPGDYIELEADFVENEECVLKADQAHQVVAKQSREEGARYDAFYVESEGRLIAVSPAFISSYTLNEDPFKPL